MFHVLGNYVAFDILCAFIYSVTLLPALLSILPLRARPVVDDRASFFNRFSDFVLAHYRFLIWFVALLGIVLITGISRNELSDSWVHYFDERYEFRRATDFVSESLTGLDTLEYSLDSGRDGGITNPEYLRTIDAFAKWFRQQPEVFHVRTLADTIKRLNKNMHGDDPDFYRLPDNQELAAQYLLLYELSLPFGLDLNDRIDIGKSATRMSVIVRSPSSQGHRDLDARAQAWFRENAPSLAIPASGVTMIFAHLSKRNIDSMLWGTFVAMALISLILIWVFKSLKIGLISLIPNFMPAAMSFGLWGYLVGQVSLSASTTTIIAFGIIVDDTVHFLSRYMKARQEGLGASEAVRSTFRSVGHALWTTTAALSAGFLVLASSGFTLSWALGLLVAITLVFALFADFLLLPSLLIAVDRRKS